MSLKTAVKAALVLAGISLLLFLGITPPADRGDKSLLAGLLILPVCFILLVYIPGFFVRLLVKLFPNHRDLRYLPAVLAVDGFLFLIHRYFFYNGVNKDFFELLFYPFIAVLCFITFISSFIAAKIN